MHSPGVPVESLHQQLTREYEMRHYHELEWNKQMSKRVFVWNSDNFSLPVRARQELSRYQKTRPCNVKLSDVIITVIKSIFKGK